MAVSVLIDEDDDNDDDGGDDGGGGNRERERGVEGGGEGVFSLCQTGCYRKDAGLCVRK